jgi:RNA recognition motif-containing protein
MKLFIANFEKDITEEESQELFLCFGKVSYVKIWTDLESCESRGFGFVDMPDDYWAEQAIETLDKTYWHGKRLKVSKARDQRW